MGSCTAASFWEFVVSSTPVLRYYNLKEDVTLQCDASQSGLGAALQQNGQPVAYASRGLTDTETRYAQIEKELLAIVFGCEHFEAYTYGWEIVHVETDHQSLEAISYYTVHRVDMILWLQKFNLKVRYKKGKEMFLADTLSMQSTSYWGACMQFCTRVGRGWPWIQPFWPCWQLSCRELLWTIQWWPTYET